MNTVALGRLQRALSSDWPGAFVRGAGRYAAPGEARAAGTDCPLSLNTRGTIVWAGPATREVLGWSPEDLAGNHVSVLTPRLGGDLLEAHLALVLAGEDVATLVDVGVKRDGRSFKAGITLEPVRTGRGDVTGVTVVLRDVTTAFRERRARVLDARSTHAVLVVDTDLTVRYATRGVSRMLGYGVEEMQARSGHGLVHPADRAALADAVDRLLLDPDRTERLVARLRDKQERWRWIEATVTNCLADPGVRGLVADLRDVTDQVHTRDAIRLSGALHQAVVDTAEEGIAVAAPDGTTIYANRSMAGLLGIPLERVYGTDAATLLAGPSAEGATASDAGVRRHEVVHGDVDGGDRILEVTRSPLAMGEAGGTGSLVVVADVTEARRAERALRRRALYDPLTGLPNRYLFLDRLEMAAARQARSEGEGIAVLFLDLDGLKPVNDAHGHHTGDELLREVASRLAGAVRATDTVGRHGGDEFVIICEDIDEAAAASVAARIQGALGTPVRLAAGSVRVSVSIGLALSPPYAIGELVRRADAAMYHAKEHGGGRTAVAHRDGDVVLAPELYAVSAQPPLPREGDATS